MAELVVALDYPEAEQALHMARQLSGRALWMKIGLELFCRQGPDIVSRIRDTGCKVFLDLKFHDIPNTVYGAVRNAARTGADMLTLHCSGGEAMLRAAVQAKQDAQQDGSHGPILLGVTALTSLDDAQAKAVYSHSASEAATHLAQIANGSGLDGIVCSALEVCLMKKSFGRTFVCLTPGIRMEKTDDDQARIATPQAAVRDGSDYLVVGRPITRADSPAKAADEFMAAMSR
jgi:orotidine-5'-phosphate decarboxylase